MITNFCVFIFLHFFLFLVTCTFTNTLKFVVKDCDPSTGEPDDEGYEDEYVVSNRNNPLSPMIHIHILQTDLNGSWLGCAVVPVMGAYFNLGAGC